MIAAPSVSAFLNRVKLDQAIAEVRGALEETQRQAIRDNRTCTVTVNLIDANVTGSCLTTGNRYLPKNIAIATNMTNEITEIETATGIPTAIVSDTSLSWGLNQESDAIKIAMARDLDNPQEEIKAAIVINIIAEAGGHCKEQGIGAETCESSTTLIPVKYGKLGTAHFTVATSVEPPNVPLDPSGKIVLSFANNSSNSAQKCIAISQTLGLTRIGTYTGGTIPAEITDSGVCTAKSWEVQ